MQTNIIVESADVTTPAQHIAASIGAHLEAGKAVLWVVSGGSAIKVAVLARSLLGKQDDADRLHVALVDERFGEPGHDGSNATQLKLLGFDTTGLAFHPVLTGQAIKATTRAYDATICGLISQADKVIGLFGMGSDGHTAGLLPGNPLMDSSQLVGHFDGTDYQRITITPAFIRKCDEIVLYAVGAVKWPVLENLATTKLPVASLREVSNLTLYTDYKELSA